MTRLLPAGAVLLGLMVLLVQPALAPGADDDLARELPPVGETQVAIPSKWRAQV